MTGAGEDRGRESDPADFGPPTGDFGPPTGDFGPPVSEFGPPVSEFGPPTGDLPVQGWQPAGADNPELAWRPADGASGAVPEPPAVPAPPPQYRAPDSSTPAYPATGDSVPVTRPRPGSTDDTTVRHSVPTDPAQRRPGADRTAEPEQATVRHSAADLRWPGTEPSDRGDGPVLPRSGGLSWDSDPIAQKLTPQSVSSALAEKPRRGLPVGTIVAVAAVIVAFIAVGVAIVVVRGGGEGGTGPTAEAIEGLGCPATQDGAVTVGNGAGDTTSGPDAVLGFQHAFYTQRSGTGAREFVAPDSPAISAAETIQGAIDEQIPAGTQHCVRITERTANTFDVDLTERRPNGATTVYKQTVTTVERDGKTLLWVIEDRR
ncbi:hypothetical protein HGA13_28765 [Nocardia speluncae]|uniref:DUF8176 domain-containing protein n=1 Tax=Nocardia speluncae TaxID=419477 RepID=A0A846XL27_9NOCA|nr:hypothetical protein [Nocardia speluncae]NKY37031.1 hypothetical protein [Nocardia speluncae]